MPVFIENPRPGVINYCVRKPGQAPVIVSVQSGKFSADGKPATQVSLGSAVPREFSDPIDADDFDRIVSVVLDLLRSVNQADCATEAWAVGLAFPPRPKKL